MKKMSDGAAHTLSQQEDWVWGLLCPIFSKCPPALVRHRSELFHGGLLSHPLSCCLIKRLSPNPQHAVSSWGPRRRGGDVWSGDLGLVEV